MDSSIGKKTQETLGKVIKKPPLTDKLLSKPPFRFLHDILTEVIKNTGFLKGLYTADEMNSSNVKEKDAKIAFLQKAIDVVVIVSGASLSVRPSKIVAGHEPEKTNEFLQAMAKAIIAKKSSSEAVKTVLSGGKPSKAPSEGKRKDRSSSRDREKSKEKETDKKDEKRKDSAKDSSERKKREDSGRKDKEKEAEKKAESVKERKQEKERHKERPVEKEKQSKREVEQTDGTDATASPEDGDAPPSRMPRPTSAKGQRRRPADGDGDDSQEPETNGVAGTDTSPIPTEQMNGILSDEPLSQPVAPRRPMPRPSSSRPAPPKIKKQQEDLDDQVGRIGSGKQVTSVIVDDGKDQDDDDETFVVEDPNTMANHIDSTPSNESLDTDSTEHGGLVRKILETKKELEGSNEQQGKARQDKPTPIISDAARRKERELAQKEIEKLRSSIQTLTRSANPLGKIMDYVQEDVDSMNKELEIWRTENKNHAIALKREQSITDTEIEPLRAQLEELDSEINDMVDRISTVKCNILKNDERIQKMLSSISFNSR